MPVARSARAITSARIAATPAAMSGSLTWTLRARPTTRLREPFHGTSRPLGHAITKQRACRAWTAVGTERAVERKCRGPLRWAGDVCLLLAGTRYDSHHARESDSRGDITQRSIPGEIWFFRVERNCPGGGIAKGWWRAALCWRRRATRLRSRARKR